MDKKRIKKLLTGILPFLLIVALLWMLPGRTVKPNNPISDKTTKLKTNFGTGGQSGKKKEQLKNGTDDKAQKNGNGSGTKTQEMSKENTTQKKQKKTKKSSGSKAQKQKGNQETKGDNGKPDDKVPGKNPNGDNDADSGKHNLKKPDNGDNTGNKDGKLVTDLYSRTITYSELTEDKLDFYAYYSKSDVDAKIKVNYKHENDTGNGTWLKSENQKDYQATLKHGKNVITIYYTDEKGNRDWVQAVVNYEADKADKNNPTVGKHPPLIETNLDDGLNTIHTSEFTFTVSAKTWEEKRIYSNAIRVIMDGKEVTNPTGSGVYEYELQFKRPNVGDTSDHVITVLAWDKAGNSKYVEYKLRYQYHNKDEKIGSVSVVIDATTVECGVVEEGTVDVKAGDTAAEAVLKMLDDYGYAYNSGGSVKQEFYLSSIARADAFKGCKIGERLEKLLKRDGITFTSPGSRDRLSEFDFTRGSGWLYFINGSYCPGKAMSAWKLNGGEKIVLRYTVAYGKDVGVTATTEGTLSGYCAVWRDGEIIEQGHSYKETSRVEPTATKDGYVEYTCKRCGETKRETLPATGNSEKPDRPGSTDKPDSSDKPGSTDKPDSSDKTQPTDKEETTADTLK